MSIGTAVERVRNSVTPKSGSRATGASLADQLEAARAVTATAASRERDVRAELASLPNSGKRSLTDQRGFEDLSIELEGAMSAHQTAAIEVRQIAERLRDELQPQHAAALASAVTDHLRAARALVPSAVKVRHTLHSNWLALPVEVRGPSPLNRPALELPLLSEIVPGFECESRLERLERFIGKEYGITI